MTTKQAARGKWEGILQHLIGQEAITRKHGPCPMCGGKDRYRFDNKRNDGDWYCNHCGVGDGFKLLQETLGIDFAEAARQVDRIVGNIEEKPFQEQIDMERRRRSLNSLWQSGTQPDLALSYLKGRGIPHEVLINIRDIRGTGMCWHNDEKVHHQAMLALIRNAKGEPVSIHRTYLLDHGKKEKKIMPPVENITGSTVRLGEPQDTLVLAEGIETALAAWAITGHPAWATISAHGLAEMKSIPRHVTKVIVAADNDASFTGQAAAFACAKYMKNRLSVDTVVTMPKIIGMDMLDVLQEMIDLSPDGRARQSGFEPKLWRWAP